MLIEVSGTPCTTVPFHVSEPKSPCTADSEGLTRAISTTVAHAVTTIVRRLVRRLCWDRDKTVITAPRRNIPFGRSVKVSPATSQSGDQVRRSRSIARPRQ